MATMRVLNSSGDRRLDWDVARAREGDPEALAAIAEAEAVFAEARSRGGTAVKLRPGMPAERIDEFDPEAEQIVVVPRVAGG
jgi:hypothetical protein